MNNGHLIFFSLQVLVSQMFIFGDFLIIYDSKKKKVFGFQTVHQVKPQINQ